MALRQSPLIPRGECCEPGDSDEYDRGTCSVAGQVADPRLA